MGQAFQKSNANLAGAIGSRVTIRLRDAGGGFRDIVGILQSLQGGSGQLLNSKGVEVKFAEAEIAIWREIKPLPDRAGTGAPYSHRIMELEILSDKTWPADKVIELGNWRLRISDGFTMRANSVLPTGAAPFGEPGLEISDAINTIIDIYKEHNLTPTFTIPLPVYEELDNYLASLGWTVKIGAEYLVNDIPSDLEITHPEFQLLIASEPSKEWLAVQSDFALERIMRNYPAQYAQIFFGEKIIAIGRIATLGSWSLATRVFVDPDFRGRGVGTYLMNALAAAARAEGATKIGLQVDAENGAGLSLYKSLGYRFHHPYTYRVLENVGV
jgi:GNAT superfamily N-acetyltransferase